MAIETKSRSLSNSLLLFGPQLTRLIPSHLSEMRAKILNKGDDNKFGFIADVIRKLPSKWPVVAKSCPSLVSLAGDENLQKLVRYLDTGDVVHVDSPGNVLLAPLTVVSQIIEYIQLEGQPVNVQGFCIGFLTAATVSCAKDQSELEELVATSILLAVCIGAIIDADEQSRQDISARNTTYSVHWSSSLQNAHFQKSLESFPEVSKLRLILHEWKVRSYRESRLTKRLMNRHISLVLQMQPEQQSRYRYVTLMDSYQS